ncbi:MAG TPA: putative toxin-antitoxin system toxin component, PIN family [Planctomycetota bacterium]|jgi:putative PIN family toxin of toxin-antitoxin system
MRIVLDSNVLLAALISRGACAKLLDHVILNHTVIGSEFLFGEVREHLVGKFGSTPTDAHEAISLLRSKMEIVAPVPLPSSICRDKDDDMVLATAVTGQVACIVTGDGDLLVLGEYVGIKILRPSQFPDFEAAHEGKP